MVKVIIVDGNDNEIGLKERDMWEDGEIHRVSALWATNSNGEILLARRSLKKKHAAGLWGPAVAGTNDEGETYETNMVKETMEEIGVSITIADLTAGPKILFGQPNNRRFIQWFFATFDIPADQLTLEEEEVMEARWVTPNELKRWYAERPDEFVKTIVPVIDTFLNK